MQLSINDLFASPDLYLFAFDGGNAQFRRMDRAAYARSIFLDARIAPADPQVLQVPIAPLLQHLPRVRAARTGWIFHVAQCGSTLLARALDREANLVLREPLALRQLGAMGQGGAGARQALLPLTATMLARRYRRDLPTIVKANVPVNFILPEIAARDPQAPAIFLYFAFEPYLLAVLRTPGHRQWVQRVTGELGAALHGVAGDLSGLGDAERAAALWLAQLRAFDAAMALLPNSHALDAAMLLDHPRPVIAAASTLFGAPIDAAALDALLAGPLFATYSKNPSIAFDNTARRTRAAEAAQALAPEIARARRWLDSRLADAPLPDRLARPLAGESPLLLG